MSLNNGEGSSAYSFGLNENINTVLAYCDKSEICRFINNAAFNWFGKFPKGVIDKMSLRDIFGPFYEQNRPFVMNALNGETQVYNVMFPVSSGKVINTRITYVPAVDEDEVKGIFVHLTDVGNLKHGDQPILNGTIKKLVPYNHPDIESVEQTLRESILANFPGISNIAKKHGISESKLKRDFKDKYGTTIFVYYRNLQMELASHYIDSKKFNKNELALMFNFSNPSNFSSCYKKYLKNKQANIIPSKSNYVNYKYFVEHSAAAVAMFDINMHLIVTSKKWKYVYSLNDIDAPGKSLNDIVPLIEEKLRAIQFDLLKGNINNYIDIDLAQKDNTPKWLRLVVQPWYTNIDEVGGVLIIAENITDIKQEEEKDKQFFEIFNKTSEIERIGIWYCDFALDIAEWSKITREILEVDDDYVIPDLETSLNFYKGTSRDIVRRSLKEALKKSSSFDIEVEVITAKGNAKHVRVIAYSEFENGRCKKISGIFHEIKLINE